MVDDTDEKPKRRSRDERLAEKHSVAMQRMDAIWSVVREERAMALFDRRFATIRGAQWEGQGAPIDDDAEETGGPARMEVPKFLRPIRRVLGEYRASRKTVDFKAKGEERSAADNLDGLYRADENDTPGGGQAAYDNAFGEAIKGGFGGWRLRSRYEDESDEKNEHQRISIEPIYDADQSLFFDINAKNQDKSDARHAFLLFTLTRDAFEEKYPDATPITFDESERVYDYDWTQADTITLAEYFEVEDRSVLRRTFRMTTMDKIAADIADVEADEVTYDDKELQEEREDGTTLQAELRAKGYRQIRQRRIQRQRVRKYLLSGSEVLEDEGYIAGTRIPLVPLYAERSYVNGIERSQGMVRPAIDPTRINNLIVSNLADSASGPTSKTPIFAPEQVDGGILATWANRKIERPSVLLARPIYSEDGQTIIAAGPTAWVEPDGIPDTVAVLMQTMGGTIDELMGVNAAAETVPANTSAAAIELVQDRGDVNDFLWHDNFALALQCSGSIWLGMAKDLYVEPGRKMIARDPEGKQVPVVLGEKKYDDGEVATNDLSTGTYDVEVDVGPATKTKRDATVKSMIALATAYGPTNPDNANAALGIAVINMEGEGTDAYRAWVRKQGVAGGWVEPNEEEKLEMAQAQETAQPDPNTVIAQAAMVTAQAELKNAETKEMEAQARYLTAQANLKIAEAKATVALASIDRDDAKQMLDEVRAETDSDRADEKLTLDTAKLTTDFERHDRDMNQPGVPNGQ